MPQQCKPIKPSKPQLEHQVSSKMRVRCKVTTAGLPSLSHSEGVLAGRVVSVTGRWNGSRFVTEHIFTTSGLSPRVLSPLHTLVTA